MKNIKSYSKYTLIKESEYTIPRWIAFASKNDTNVLLYTNDTLKELEFKPAERIKDLFEHISRNGRLLNLAVTKTEDKWIFKKGYGGFDGIVNWYLIPQNNKTFDIWTAKDLQGKNHNVGVLDMKNFKYEIDHIKLMQYLTSIMVDKI